MVSEWTTVRWRFAYFNNFLKFNGNSVFSKKSQKLKIFKILIFPLKTNLNQLFEHPNEFQNFREHSEPETIIFNRIIFKEIVMRSKNLNSIFSKMPFLVKPSFFHRNGLFRCLCKKLYIKRRDKFSSLALDYESRGRKQYLRVLLSTVRQNPIMLVLDDAESGGTPKYSTNIPKWQNSDIILTILGCGSK